MNMSNSTDTIEGEDEAQERTFTSLSTLGANAPLSPTGGGVTGAESTIAMIKSYFEVFATNLHPSSRLASARSLLMMPVIRHCQASRL